MAEKVALQGVPETPMPWGIDVNELAGLRAIHPNIVSVREVDIGRGQGFVFGSLIPFLSRLPIPGFIANKRPAFVVVRFGEVGGG